jgi:hypothetical protein
MAQEEKRYPRYGIWDRVFFAWFVVKLRFRTNDSSAVGALGSCIMEFIGSNRNRCVVAFGHPILSLLYRQGRDYHINNSYGLSA